MRVVVVGSGIAGLIAAAEASRAHTVTLVTKSTLAESNTHYAQGGVAAVTSTDDTVAEHVTDTLAAGAGLCWRPAVEVLCAEGPAGINELVSFGVAFDKSNGQYDRGLEAAHSHPRILHAGGDATGAQISQSLVSATRRTATQIFENSFLLGINTDAGRVVGVDVLSAGTIHSIEADAVILASGGAGQLFRHTTNPIVTTGDGVAAALRAGAALTDLEFYQFHPTALAVPGSFLISEAVRGEGAVLVNQAGERFMTTVDPRAELAPRDVVARSIQAEMLQQGGQPVLLDATSLGAAFLAERFPSINKVCRGYGLDWSKEPIPVTPAAHYWMGGVATDLDGRTSVPGLYAVGEVACTGAHGANRLASNSLLESVVSSRRAVAALGRDWPDDAAAARWAASGPLAEIEIDVNAIHGRSASGELLATDDRRVVDRVELQTLMWDSVGLARQESDLAPAQAVLDNWKPSARAHRFFTDWEDANLLLLAHAMTASARARQESRGAHYRLDYPTTVAEDARPIVVKKSA